MTHNAFVLYKLSKNSNFVFVWLTIFKFQINYIYDKISAHVVIYYNVVFILHVYTNAILMLIVQMH